MKYKVHRIEVKSETMDTTLENYLNNIKEEVISILPNVALTFMMMGATAKVDSLIIVTKVNRN